MTAMAAVGGQGSPPQGKEVVFDLDAAAFSSDHFRMYEFKVKRCPRARPHDWTQCPFAHPGEKARRRDPRRYRYSGTACPEFRKSGCCRRGDACPFAHGVFECWLHPSRYRTQLCTDGAACKRRVCFFAHGESELRRPEDDPLVAQCQVQAELAAEVQSLQQQHISQALSSFVEANGHNPQGVTAGFANGQLNLLTLELMKQATPAMGSTLTPSGDQPSNTGLQLALLQQLALVEQVQKQQQQREQAQELLNGYGTPGTGTQDMSVKNLQALLAAMSQNGIQQALKSQLAEQVSTSGPMLEALGGLTVNSTPPAAPGLVLSEAQMPASAAMPAMNDALGGYGAGGQPQDGATVVSAATAMNGAVGGYEMQGAVTAGTPMHQNGAVQTNGQTPHLQTNGFLAPGQLVALRSRAAALTGGRRSIDNGVLARSMNELVGALDASGLGAGPRTAGLGADLANCQVPFMYSAPVAAAPTPRAMEPFAGLADKEALQQAKSLLENLHMLQGGKNGTSGAALMQGVNMETLLAANGLSAMSRAASFDKILEELPKNMGEDGPLQSAHYLPQAMGVAGGDYTL